MRRNAEVRLAVIERLLVWRLFRPARAPRGL
jgi:hypothetical protein